MSAQEIIEQIKALPPEERAKVAKDVMEEDDSCVPESVREGMANAEAGRFVDMELVLSGAKPPGQRSPPRAHFEKCAALAARLCVQVGYVRVTASRWLPRPLGLRDGLADCQFAVGMR